MNALLELDDIEELPAREAVRGQVNSFLDLVEKCARDALANDEFAPLDTRRFSLELYGCLAGCPLWRALARKGNGDAMARKASEELLARAEAAS